MLDVFIVKLPGFSSDVLDQIITLLDSYGIYSEKLQLVEGFCILRTNDFASTLDALNWYHIPIVRCYKCTR
jgi:hypothetical protein